MSIKTIALYTFSDLSPEHIRKIVDGNFQPRLSLTDYLDIRILKGSTLKDTYDQYSEIWIIGECFDSEFIDVLKDGKVTLYMLPTLASFYEAFLLKVVFPGSNPLPKCTGNRKQDFND